MSRLPGILITFEGPEGSGKTTQARRLAAALTESGREVVLTREPGGTPVGERIREVLLDPGSEVPPLPRTEALLFCAARAELVGRILRPSLAAGAVVLCDRYLDATYAYQGHAAGVDMGQLRGVIEFATGGLAPDLTILLDLDVAQGLARRRRDSADWNRLDASPDEYHARVRDGYLSLAAAEPRRWRVVAADADPDTVASAVLSAVASSGVLDASPAALGQ